MINNLTHESGYFRKKSIMYENILLSLKEKVNIF